MDLRLISLFGWIAMIAAAWAISYNRKLFPWRTVVWGVGLQFTLAREIERDFHGREMVVISLLNGTVMFLADLLRHVNLPLRLDFLGVSSYGEGVKPGEPVFTKELRLDVRGRDVLVVDDILDTGQTLSRVLPKLRALKPRRIKICVLLDKPARRVETIEADYIGFIVPDEFVVGYGLDFAERHRNLPFVGVLHPQIYKQACRRISRK